MSGFVLVQKCMGWVGWFRFYTNFGTGETLWSADHRRFNGFNRQRRARHRGTRHFALLLADQTARRKGCPATWTEINWIHTVRPISLKHSMRAEYGNWSLALIRRFWLIGLCINRLSRKTGGTSVLVCLTARFDDL